jgi:hypothetical protein
VLLFLQRALVYVGALALVLWVSFFVPLFVEEGRFFAHAVPAGSGFFLGLFPAFLEFFRGLGSWDGGLAWSRHPADVLALVRNTVPGVLLGFVLPFLGGAFLGAWLGRVRNSLLGLLMLLSGAFPVFLSGALMPLPLAVLLFALANTSVRTQLSYHIEQQKPYVHFALLQGMSERRARRYAFFEAFKSLLVFWRRMLPLFFVSFVAAQALAGTGLGSLLSQAARFADIPLLRGALLAALLAAWALSVACDLLCLFFGARKHRKSKPAYLFRSPFFVVSALLFAGLFAYGIAGDETSLQLLGLSLLLGFLLAIVFQAYSRWPACALYALSFVAALSALGLAPFPYEAGLVALLSLAFCLFQRSFYAEPQRP